MIAEFAGMGVKRFVALRGDPAAGVGACYQPHPGGYANGAELVGALKAQGDFDISVSAYPEKHPESPDFATDIDMLKRKVDNGATRAITQFFFDNDLYESYVERARRAGIYIPIVPGVLPIHNFTQVANFSARCGAHVPAWLAERFDGLQDDPQTHALVAAAVAAEQVMDLVERGVSRLPFLHDEPRRPGLRHLPHDRHQGASAEADGARPTEPPPPPDAFPELRRKRKKAGLSPGLSEISIAIFRLLHSRSVGLRKNSHYEGADKSKRSANHECIDWPCQSHS